MNTNKQLLVNIVSQFVVFSVQLVIGFFLTPFIVKHLGASAYGFVGLTTNIIGYTQLITVALNSMASRFITVSYHRGEIEKARKFFTSVFYSNLFLSILFLICSSITIFYLEVLIEIPDNLLVDVKILFILLFLDSIINLSMNVFKVATFIKNKLELNSIRQLISNIYRLILLLIFFGCFTPHVWYLGLISLLCTIYIVCTNLYYTKKLTPDLYLRYKNYDFKSVKQMIKAGSWNIINHLSVVLGQGFDLLLANAFIGPTLMGVLSLSKTIPAILISILSLISTSFSPILTQLYAKDDINQLKFQLNKSIHIMTMITCIPATFFLVYGEAFYKLWLPSQDSRLLYLLTIVTIIEFSIAAPMESLWDIFTITNKVKKPAINLLEFSLLTLITVMIGMLVTENNEMKLYILAITRAAYSILRLCTFLPLYGAKCIGQKNRYFYKPILINIISIILSVAFVSFFIKPIIIIDSWSTLIFSGFSCALVGWMVTWTVVLSSDERKYMMSVIINQIHKII